MSTRLARLSCLALLFVAAWSSAHALPRADAGTLLLKSGPDAAPVEAVRVATGFRVRVTGNVARVHVTQRFTNPTADWVEGLYVFPLADGAAVDGLSMRVGERVVRGEIREREEARAVYERARDEGRRASLVDQERPNLFTSAVANIAPGSSIEVEIEYLETIPWRDGRYALKLPLAITPRYTPGASAEPGAPLAIEQARLVNATTGLTPTPERVTAPQQRVDIDVELAPGFPLQDVQSLHHAVSLADTATGRRLTLTAPQVPADRDFELVWQPAAAPDTHAAVFAERVAGATYALVMLSPPEVLESRPGPREVLFVVDTSGSMQGPSLAQARAALQLGIERLRPGDHFNVIRFSDDASALFPHSEPAGRAARRFAASHVEALQADGGTMMRSALELAFATPPVEGALRQIVFITDGSVGNEAELVSLVHGRIGQARLFTVGIGAAPNAWFMREAAAAGRGSYTFIADVGQVAARMQDLFRKLEQPALTDLELHWPDGTTVELAAALPGDVYAGDPLVVAARLAAQPAGVLTLSGRSRGQAWVQQLPIVVLDGGAGIDKLWARERIGELARRLRLGLAGGDAEARMLELALRHHLVTERTSLVAVDVTPARPGWAPQHAAQASTSAPAGGYWAGTTGFAGTATPAPWFLLAGAVALALAVLLWAFGGEGRPRRSG